MRIDLHCHTEASPDSQTPVAAIPLRCQELDIAVQAITDHDGVWAAQRVKTLVEEEGRDLQVIVGEEIKTRDGEIIGLFLEELVDPGLSADETVEAVKAQGGLVLLPHPFDRMKWHRLKADARSRVAGSIDVVEVFNATVSRQRWNREAARWADGWGLLKSAGSDAHTLAGMGRVWVETPLRVIERPADLMEALRVGQIEGRWSHPILTLARKVGDRARRRIGL